MGKTYRDRSGRNFDDDDQQYPLGYRDDEEVNRRIRERDHNRCEKKKKKGFKDIKEYDNYVDPDFTKSW